MMLENRLRFASPNLNVMLKAAMTASRGIIRDFGELEKLQVSRKGTGGFVTKTDERAEKIIREHLQKARPNYSLLMEESGEHEGSDPYHRWIVDPLDGTTNFMHGYPHFCTSIALEKEGEIICALVYDPIKDELFYSEKGRGAFLNDQRLRVSGRDKCEDALIGLGFPHKGYNGGLNFFEIHRDINKAVHSTRRSGSSILDLCYVAAGRLDAYFCPDLKPWDMAAGLLFIKEAGGYARDPWGGNECLTKEAIVAGNETLSNALLRLIKEAK